jgi:hypothetical protein
MSESDIPYQRLDEPPSFKKKFLSFVTKFNSYFQIPLPIPGQFLEHGRYKYLGDLEWLDTSNNLVFNNDSCVIRSIFEDMKPDKIPIGSLARTNKAYYIYIGSQDWCRYKSNQSLFKSVRRIPDQNLKTLKILPLIPPIGITADNGRYQFCYNAKYLALQKSHFNIFDLCGWYDSRSSKIFFGEGVTWTKTLDFTEINQSAVHLNNKTPIYYKMNIMKHVDSGLTAPCYKRDGSNKYTPIFNSRMIIKDYYERNKDVINWDLLW